MAHQVVLTWKDSIDGGSVNVFRGTVSGQEGNTPINPTLIAAGVQTFTDTNPVLGVNDYEVRAVVNGSTSGPSNEVSCEILPASPTALNITSFS